MFFLPSQHTVGVHCIHGLSSQMLANAGVFVPDSFDTLGALIGYALISPSLTPFKQNTIHHFPGSLKPLNLLKLKAKPGGGDNTPQTPLNCHAYGWP